MITFEQLQAMSDFEVNKALCIKLGYDVSGISEQRNMMTGAVTDYCSNPNDIMPMAFEHNISIISCDGGNTWWAEYATEINQQFIMCSEQSYQDANPLRAIACCLIIVLQEKQK